MLPFTPVTDVIKLKLFDNEILIRNIAVQLITTVQHRKQVNHRDESHSYSLATLIWSLFCTISRLYKRLFHHDNRTKLM